MQRITQLLQSSEPIKWLFYGDSITHGAFHTFGARDYSEHFDERVRFEMGRYNDVIINTAISGQTTRELLNGFDWRVRQFSPHVVFIMIGMNDCSETRALSPEEFRANLKQFNQQLVDINALPVLQTTCPILPGTTPDREPYFSQYMDIVREVAREGNWPLVDHLAFWEANRAKHYYWMHDPFHPGAHGHLVFAHTLFRELGIFDANSNVCRLFTP
jgi:lysophospholipase L1-like esterase